MESKSFPSNFDIARRYAKHRKQHYLRYGEQRDVDGVPQGFISSHSIENYKWIFTRQTPTGTNSAGYVKPRN